MYRSIVVGTDGSDSAGVALARAVELARASGALLHLVTAVEPLSAGRIRTALGEVPEEDRHRLNLMQEADAVLERAIERIGADDLEIETHPMAADAAEAIITVAERQRSDLIVVGNKGMIGTGRFLLGSVPNKISHHSPCDVLIVRTT